MWMFPPSYGTGESLRALFNDPVGWAQTRSRITGLGYADHWLYHQFSDAELRPWFRQLAGWHIKLGLEVGALKPWGLTGDIAFKHDRQQWDRFIADGASIDSIAMDEPLAFSQVTMQQSIDFAADQTARFVALVRQTYPAASIGDIEPYPGIPAEDTLAFIDAVQARLRQWHVHGLDFFRADVDWMRFRPGDPKGAAGWAGVRALQAQCHARGLPFSLIYWAADFPYLKRVGTATDETWEEGIMHEGAAYAATGAVPDEMVVESWLPTPDQALPETAPGTFTRSVLDFSNQFAP
jgi:hypothetical protein